MNDKKELKKKIQKCLVQRLMIFVVPFKKEINLNSSNRTQVKSDNLNGFCVFFRVLNSVLECKLKHICMFCTFPHVLVLFSSYFPIQTTISLILFKYLQLNLSTIIITVIIYKCTSNSFV